MKAIVELLSVVVCDTLNKLLFTFVMERVIARDSLCTRRQKRHELSLTSLWCQAVDLLYGSTVNYRKKRGTLGRPERKYI